ncbi:hypothetical protein RCL1_008490 [Eukaryota sp. TZLM3-RCL]
MTLSHLQCAVSKKPITELQEQFFSSRKDLCNADEFAILLTKDELELGCQRMADQLNKDFAGQEVTILGVLNGACWFVTDLSRLLNFPVTFHFVRASSYGKALASSGVVQCDLSHLVPEDFVGKKVLIVDELFDSGKTITVLKQAVTNTFSLNPQDVKSVTLMSTSKPTSEPPADYCYFRSFTNMWILGYGLDHRHYFRNYPHVLAFFNPAFDAQDLKQKYDDSRRRITELITFN